MVRTPGECEAGQGRPEGAAEAAKHGSEAVESTEDAERGGRVGEQNGGGGESDDDAKALEEHDNAEGDVTSRGRLKEGGVGGQEIDYGEGDGCVLVSVYVWLTL